jgi:hypothetical protein
MNIIIFCNIPMLKEFHRTKSINGCGKECFFPISEIFEREINNDDLVDIIMLGTDGTDVSSNDNYKKLIDELTEINKDVNCKMEFNKVSCDFDESPASYYERLKGIIKYFKEDAVCISDITFGPRTLSIILFNALTYGEKFYNLDIHKIIYRKIEFSKDSAGKTEITNPEICDITSLFTFGNMFQSMPDVSPEKANLLLTKILKEQ